MDRIWLKHYPEGVPHEVDPARYASLVTLLDESFRKYRERDAFIFMDKHLTYGELDEQSRAFAAFLQSRGVKPGTRVALMMPNCLQYPVCIVGVLRAGCTVVNVNPLYTPHELEYQLKDSGAEAIVILENFAANLQKVLADTPVKHVVVTSLGELLGFPKSMIVNFVVRRVKKMVPAFSLPDSIAFNSALAEGKATGLQEQSVGPEGLAFLQYTGGTTGVSKGAMLTHRNVVANVLQNDAFLQPALQREPRVERLFSVAALPLYHIFALTAAMLLTLHVGGVCLLIANPRDIPGLIKELRKHRINFLPAVNTLFNALMHHRDFTKIDFSGLKVSVGGGMAVQKAVADRWFELTGSPVVEGYGLSETSPVLTCNPPDTTEFSGTIGLPLPSTEISIRDEEGNALPLGEPGEICARGPQVMAGYWNRPDETAAVTTADGFFRTGDIGIMDEKGQVKIVDRKKDMINVSGFKVYPNELEGVCAQHPGVLECAAVGVPDKEGAEAVKLFVVKKDPALEESALRRFLAEELTNYKRPKFIEFRSELPKTNIGKILRRELRNEVKANPG